MHRCSYFICNRHTTNCFWWWWSLWFLFNLGVSQQIPQVRHISPVTCRDILHAAVAPATQWPMTLRQSRVNRAASRVASIHCQRSILLSLNTDARFTIPWRVEGWVNLGKAARICLLWCTSVFFNSDLPLLANKFICFVIMQFLQL